MSDADPGRRISRRAFLVGGGLGLAAFLGEAGSTVVRAAMGQGRLGISEPRGLAGIVKRWLLPPRVALEEVATIPLPIAPAQPALRASFRRPDLRIKIGQMLLIGFRGNSGGAGTQIHREITDHAIGGVVLMDRVAGSGRLVRNISSPAQLRRLTAELQAAALATAPGTPLIVAVDEEGGSVARLSPRNGFPATMSAATLGARNDPAFTTARAAEIGHTLASVGINLNLAPVVDVNVNPRNPAIGRNGRSFSADAGVVTAQARAFVAGLREGGVRATLKHFPGQGSAAADTHLGVVDVTRRWTDVELQPFAALVASGDADAVMTGHIFNARLDARHPATLSRAVVTGILRDRLGYGGVIVSDDLQMGAIRAAYGWDEAVALAVAAGIDLLMIADPPQSGGSLVGRTIDLIEDLVAAGRVTEARIDASYDRIQRLKASLLRP
jgi:beta-N-acetylhexosaminidase